MVKLDNAATRDQWIKQQLQSLAPNTSMLDVGAGECPYKPLCSHLEYVAQDVNIYDGEGNRKGLQMGKWNFEQIDIVCDLLEIPEDRTYDAILCTEVLEHVPDPVRCLEKLSRLLRPDGGKLIVTAPFASLTHFAPYHFSTGFSEYFYRHHLERLGLKIVEISPNGGFFDFLAQELGRFASVHEKYFGRGPAVTTKLVAKACRKLMKGVARRERLKAGVSSSELLTFGLHIVAEFPCGREQRGV